MNRLRLLAILFALSAAGVSTLSYSVLEQFSALSAKTASVDSVHGTLVLLSRLEAGVKDLERLERSYLLTTDPAYPPRINAAVREMWPRTEALRDYYPTGSAARSTTVLLRAEIFERIRLVRALLDSLAAGSPVPASALAAGRDVTRSALDKIDSLQRAQTAALVAQTASRGRVSGSASSAVHGVLIFFCISMAVLFVLLTRELVRNVRGQETLRRQLGALQQAHAELDQIAYAVSHHVQEPLRKVGLFSDLILRSAASAALPADTAQSIHRLAASAAHARGMVAGLAGFATASSSADDAPAAVPLRPLVLDVLKDFDESVQRTGAVITVEALPVVTGREGQLRVLLAALIDNALKFSHPDRPPQICISAAGAAPAASAAAKAFHAVHITDNGVGFEKEYAADIFRLFYRLDGFGGGTPGQGLGLALAKRIMAQHGGWVEARGTPGEGATFLLYFPADGSSGAGGHAS